MRDTHSFTNNQFRTHVPMNGRDIAYLPLGWLPIVIIEGEDIK